MFERSSHGLSGKDFINKKIDITIDTYLKHPESLSEETLDKNSFSFLSQLLNATQGRTYSISCKPEIRTKLDALLAILEKVLAKKPLSEDSYLDDSYMSHKKSNYTINYYMDVDELPSREELNRNCLEALIVMDDAFDEWVKHRFADTKYQPKREQLRDLVREVIENKPLTTPELPRFKL